MNGGCNVECAYISVASAVSDFLRHCGLQPTRLLSHWDSPGKNTGVGCLPSSWGLPHPGIEPTSPALAGGFFISEPVGKPQSRVKCQSLSRVQLFATPQSAAHQTPLSMGFSRQEYWSGLPSLLLGIFPTQGSSLSLLHCRWILYSLSPQGSP